MGLSRDWLTQPSRPWQKEAMGCISSALISAAASTNSIASCVRTPATSFAGGLVQYSEVRTWIVHITGKEIYIFKKSIWKSTAPTKPSLTSLLWLQQVEKTWLLWVFRIYSVCHFVFSIALNIHHLFSPLAILFKPGTMSLLFIIFSFRGLQKGQRSPPYPFNGFEKIYKHPNSQYISTRECLHFSKPLI